MKRGDGGIYLTRECLRPLLEELQGGPVTEGQASRALRGALEVLSCVPRAFLRTEGWRVPESVPNNLKHPQHFPERPKTPSALPKTLRSALRDLRCFRCPSAAGRAEGRGLGLRLRGSEPRPATEPRRADSGHRRVVRTGRAFAGYWGLFWMVAIACEIEQF